jgi:Rrf2 family iron-sulfur cluster assembly transcriptional regulator
LRLSTLGRYALRAMVDVAMHEDHGPVPRQEIAERQELSSSYLAQLFAQLRRASLVESVLGPGGGYVLARSAAEISAADVLRAVDESLTLVDCGSRSAECEAEAVCHRTEGCPTRPLWRQLEAQISQTLEATTLAQLCENRVPREPAHSTGQMEADR